MKIAFVCEGFSEFSVVAQPWKHIYEIASRMGDLGNEVHIITDRNQESPPLTQIGELSVHRIAKEGLVFDRRELLETVKKTHADIINCYGGPLSAFYFWRLQNRLQSDVILTMFKGRIFPEDIINLRVADIFSLPDWRALSTNVLYSLLPSFLLRQWLEAPNLKRIITWSERLKLHLLKMGISEQKITAISSGVDTKTFRPISDSDALAYRKQLGFAADDFLILYFGPLSGFRGADTVILAMKDILEGNSSAKLILLDRRLANVQSKENAIEKVAHKTSSIHLVRGIQSLSKLIQYLAVTDAVVLPFRFWPHIECPLTVLEGMAMKKPVITTNTGTVPEIVHHGKTGILVTPRKPKLVSEWVLALSKNKDMAARIGQNAREYVERYHDWNIIMHRTVDAFGDL